MLSRGLNGVYRREETALMGKTAVYRNDTNKTTYLKLLAKLLQYCEVRGLFWNRAIGF